MRVRWPATEPFTQADVPSTSLDTEELQPAARMPAKVDDG
jgi:hypothetical protein